MHFSTFLSATAFALSAKAFLIPLEVADDVEVAKNKAADRLSTIFHANSKSINLDCSSCPFALSAEPNGAHVWTHDVESDLKMTFAAKDNHLTLNGKPFYPATLQDLPGALYAPQIKKDSEFEKISKSFQNGLKLSYSLEFDNEKAEDGFELVTVTMSILGIEEQMIRVDNVQIKAIKRTDGSLTLVDVAAVPTSPNDPDARCTNMMCRVMTKLRAAMAKARAKAVSAASATSSAAKKIKCFCVRCFHRMAGHPHTVKEDNQATRLPTHNVVRPGQFGMHSGHGHHHGIFHTMLSFARNIFTFVLLPVMVGVAVGITASAIGMLVGQAVVFLWLRYRRGGNQQQAVYESVETEDKENDLPAYDAQGLPAYVDIEDEKKEVENKA